MSIKICNGYRICPMSITDLNKFLNEKVRKGIQDVMQGLYEHKCAEFLAEIADNAALQQKDFFLKDGPNVNDTYSGAVFDEGMAHLHKASTSTLRSSWDLDVEILVIPQEDGGYLALLYGEDTEYREFWKSLPEVEPFPYWNNTGRPEEMTAEQWDERRDAWEGVMPDWMPCNNGFSFKYGYLNLLNFVNFSEKVLARLQSKERRAERLAKDLLYPEFLKNSGAEEGERKFGAYMGWLRTEKGRARVKERAAEIVLELPKIDATFCQRKICDDVDFLDN